jgi:hypothetical protein
VVGEVVGEVRVEGEGGEDDEWLYWLLRLYIADEDAQIQ